MEKCLSFEQPWVKTSEKRDVFARFHLCFPKTRRVALRFTYYGYYKTYFFCVIYFYCKYDFISLFNSFFYGSSQPQYMLKNKTKNTNSAFKTKIANQEICDICKDNDPAVFSILSPNGKSLIFTPSWYYLQMTLS